MARVIGEYSNTFTLSGSGTSIDISVPKGAQSVSYRVVNIGPDAPATIGLLIGTDRRGGATLGTDFSGFTAYRVFDCPWSFQGGQVRHDLTGECDIHGAEVLTLSIGANLGNDLNVYLHLWFWEGYAPNFLGEIVTSVAQLAGAAQQTLYYDMPPGAGSISWANNVEGGGACTTNVLDLMLDIDDDDITMFRSTTAPIFSVTALTQMTYGRNSIHNIWPIVRWRVQAGAAVANDFYLRLKWFKN